MLNKNLTADQVSSKRKLIQGMAGAALLGAAGFATAQTAPWPSKPIRLVVGFAPGTAPDVFARLYGDYLSKRLGVAVVIDNKPGAGGNLATDIVAKAPADGYTFLYALSTYFTVNPFIYSKLPYDPFKDLIPVATTIRQGLVLVANPAKVPSKNLKELMVVVKAKPGALSYGSYGAGSPSHLIMEWLKDETQSHILHIPYRTNPVLGPVSGEVEMLMEPIATAIPFISSGRLKALAYSGATRHPALPDVPTLSESVPGMNVTSWHGLWAATSTPAALVSRMNADMVSISRDPEVQQRINTFNVEPLGITPLEMTAMVKRDSDIFSRVVKVRNIKVD